MDDGRGKFPKTLGTMPLHLEKPMRVLDPTFEETAVGFAAPPRLDDLRGTTIGIISNGKEGTAHLFAHLECVLRDRFGVATVVQRVKGNLSAPAGWEIMGEAAGWDAAITGVGD